MAGVPERPRIRLAAPTSAEMAAALTVESVELGLLQVRRAVAHRAARTGVRWSISC